MAASTSPDRNVRDGDAEDIDMEEDLKRVLLECGTGLIKPRGSTEELLKKLDKMEHLLQHLRQPFKELVNPALKPAKMALISDGLLRHMEMDVRFTVASCITEIIRITAPDVPYTEDQMKDYFLLVNTAFKELPSISGRAYYKVVSILQAISHCQICVMMLDYELYDMVHEMFHLFLNGIRSSHSESVSSSMEHIMTLMIQNNGDSDESMVELAKILLITLKKENENISPLAFQLAKKVFEKCANDLKDYLPKAVKCLEVAVEEYDDVVVSSFQGSTQRAGMDANEMGVDASSHGEVDLAEDGGLSKLVENDTDNMKDDENFKENHRALSHVTDLINNQELVFDIPAPDGDCPDVNDPSIDNGTKNPINKGNTDETRSDILKDENVKPWYSGSRVKDQKSVDKLSSENLTDASCSRETDSSKGCDSSLLQLKEDSQFKDHDTIFHGKSSEQHISCDACINSLSENVDGTNHMEQEVKTDDVSISQKRSRKPHSLIKPEEGYDPLWMLTEWVSTEDSSYRKNTPKNVHYEDRIIISKASQSLQSYVKEPLNAPISERHGFLELNPQEQFFKKKKDVRVDQDNGLHLLSTSVGNFCEIMASKDSTVAESTKDRNDKSSRNDFLHGVTDGILQNLVKKKRSATKAFPAKESWNKNIVLETGSSNDSADVHTLKENLRKASDKILSSNKIYKIPKHLEKAHRSSNKESHAEKSKGKTVISEDLSGDFLIKTLISQSRNKSSKMVSNSMEISYPQHQRRVISPEEEASKVNPANKCYGKELVGCKVKVWWPKDKIYYDGKVVSYDYLKKTHQVVYDDGDKEILDLRNECWEMICEDNLSSHTLTSQSTKKLSKGEADSQEASNLQQERSVISFKEENHSKKRRRTPAKKTHKVTKQGKTVISDNQTEDIIIKTLVSHSKKEDHSSEFSDPQQRISKVPSRDEASKVNPTNKCYGKELVGCKVKVWWPRDKIYYDGKVVSYDYLKKTHQVVYDEGDREILDLRNECWEMICEDNLPSHTLASQSTKKLSKGKADSQEASNLQQERSNISFKEIMYNPDGYRTTEEASLPVLHVLKMLKKFNQVCNHRNHSKKRRRTPAKKTQKVTKQGKTVNSDNQTEDIIIKTLVSHSKEDNHSSEFSDPQQWMSKVPSTDEASKVNPANKCYGKELVGCMVKVWWPRDKIYYDGKVVSYDYLKKTHQVVYDEGDREILDLRNECWEMICEDNLPSHTLASQSTKKLSKGKADSQEASNLQQERSDISFKEENHSKKRRRTPAKKTQNVTKQGKTVISDNQTAGIIIKTLVSHSKEEDHSSEFSDPQQRISKVPSRDEASKVNPTNKCYGKELVGCKIKVWWPRDKIYYDGKVASYDYLKKTHQVVYDDGDKEILDLRNECWEMICEDNLPSHRTSVPASPSASMIRSSDGGSKSSHSPKSKLKD